MVTGGHNLTKASLVGADLASADFAGADLAGASLRGADLSGAELTATNASLENVAWSAATTCPDGDPASATAGCFARPAVASPPVIELSVRRGARGAALTLTGSGFAGNETLTISIGSTRLTTATTSGKGIVGPVALAIPAFAQPGLHQITAAGKAEGQSAAAWFTVAADWDQTRYDSGLTSDNTIENTLSPAKAPAPAKEFVFSPGAGTAGAFPASVDDGAAFVASAGGPLTVISAAAGKTLWTWKEPASWGSANASPHDLLSQPVVADGTAYLSVAGQGLVAIGSGQVLWQSALEEGFYPNPSAVNLSQPTLANGLLYATEGDNLYSVDPATGVAVSSAAPAPDQLNLPNCCQPAVAGGVVYVQCDDGNLYAFSAAGLTALWSYAVPGTPQIGSTAVSGGTVYVTTTAAGVDQLIAISTSTHAQEWSFKAAAVINAPAIAGSVVYAVAQNGVLYALNAATGTLLWSKTLHDGKAERDTHGVSVADGVLYTLNASGVAYAFNATTGAQLWSYQAGNTLQATPVIANGIVYIGTRSGGVEAFTAK
jgi:outer membrane protein assembly factor BamB